jgi:hypothetical protein
MPMDNKRMVPRRTTLDPRSIANLSLWLDAADASTVTISTGVSQWNDKSGNGKNAAQGIGNNQPAYVLAARNGRNVCRMDGSNDSFVVSSIALDATISVFVAASFDVAGSAGNATGNLFIEHSANAGTNGGMFVAGQSVGPQQVQRTVVPSFRWVQNGVANWLGTGWSVAEFRFDAGAAVDTIFQYWKSGTLQSNGTAAVSAGTVTASRSVTADLFIGSRNQASIFSDGDWGEVLIYNRALTDAEHLAVRRYLSVKWGITLA